MSTFRSRLFGLAAVLSACTVAAAQPLNDNCDAAEPISGFGDFFFSNIGASTDGVPTAACSFFGQSDVGLDVWFCWTATTTEPVRIITCGLVGSLDTKIAVYDGCGPCPEAGGVIACNDDACGLQTRVEFNAVAGQSYLVRVGVYPLVTTGGEGFIRAESALPQILAGPFTNFSNGNEYYLLQTSTWAAAQAKAVQLGGNLATVRNLDENEFLRAQVLGFDGVDRRGWIGLNDNDVEGVFVWISGEPVVFTNWSGGEPNNNPPPENFVEMFGSNGLWNDANGNSLSPARFGLVEIVNGTPPCPADWNNDGVVNSSDLSAFITSWLNSVQNGNLIADFNNDGFVNSSDLSAFITAWLSAVQNGC